jgi:hypothetical protein
VAKGGVSYGVTPVKNGEGSMRRLIGFSFIAAAIRKKKDAGDGQRLLMYSVLERELHHQPAPRAK